MPSRQQTSGRRWGIMCQCPDGSMAGLNTGCKQQNRPQIQTSPATPPGTRCGTGYCLTGTKCSRSGLCIASDAVDCGTHACAFGERCAPNDCLRPGAVAQPQPSQSGLLNWLASWGKNSPVGSQIPNITGDQSLSSSVQQRYVQPTVYETERMLNDPYVGKPVATKPSPPSFDGTNLIGSESLTTVRPPAPAAGTSPQAAPGTYSGLCGSWNAQYCEVGDYLYFKNGKIFNNRTGEFQ